jgi:hypothetical protein
MPGGSKHGAVKRTKRVALGNIDKENAVNRDVAKSMQGEGPSKKKKLRKRLIQEDDQDDFTAGSGSQAQASKRETASEEGVTHTNTIKIFNRKSSLVKKGGDSKKRSAEEEGNGDDAGIPAHNAGLSPVQAAPPTMNGLVQDLHEIVRAEGPAAASSTQSASAEERAAQLEETLTKLKGRYAALKEIRMTEPERLLAEFKEHSDQRSAVQAKLVTHLQHRLEETESRALGAAPAAAMEQLAAENAELRATAATLEADKQAAIQITDETLNELEKMQLAQGSSSASSSASSSSSASASGSASASASDDGVAKLYGTLTGISVVPAPGGASGFVCTGHSRTANAAVSFRLVPQGRAQGGEEELEYAPLTNAQLLPAFLREELEFDTTEAPLFFRKVVESLYKRESELRQEARGRAAPGEEEEEEEDAVEEGGDEDDEDDEDDEEEDDNEQEEQQQQEVQPMELEQGTAAAAAAAAAAADGTPQAHEEVPTPDPDQAMETETEQVAPEEQEQQQQQQEQEQEEAVAASAAAVPAPGLETETAAVAAGIFNFVDKAQPQAPEGPEAPEGQESALQPAAKKARQKLKLKAKAKKPAAAAAMAAKRELSAEERAEQKALLRDTVKMARTPMAPRPARSEDQVKAHLMFG